MVRGICILLAAFLMIGVLLTVVSLRSHPPASARWTEFSIQPATGGSTTYNPGRLQSDGMTMLTALSIAYSFPEVRIVGPEWLSRERYAIKAALDPEAGGAFSELFQRELANYINLQVHQEKREFNVLVLRAPHPALVKAEGREPLTTLRDWACSAHAVPLDGLAAALQSIVRKPVVNETGIEGNYNFDFEWGEKRLSTVREEMRHRYGLDLAEERRVLEALIIDRAEPGASLAVITKVSHLASRLSGGIRNRIGRLVALH